MRRDDAVIGDGSEDRTDIPIHPDPAVRPRPYPGSRDTLICLPPDRVYSPLTASLSGRTRDERVVAWDRVVRKSFRTRTGSIRKPPESQNLLRGSVRAEGMLPSPHQGGKGRPAARTSSSRTRPQSRGRRPRPNVPKPRLRGGTMSPSYADYRLRTNRPAAPLISRAADSPVRPALAGRGFRSPEI